MVQTTRTPAEILLVAGNINEAHLTTHLDELATGIDDAPKSPITGTGGNLSLSADDLGKTIVVTGSATITLPEVSSVSNGWNVEILARGAAVTIATFGSETVDGNATLALVDGEAARIIFGGINFQAIEFSALGTLGTAAALNTGTTNGTIPVVGAGGKLAESLIPNVDNVIEAKTFTSQSAVSFGLTGAETFALDLTELSAGTDQMQLVLQFSTNGGSTWVSTNHDHLFEFRDQGFSTLGSASSQANIPITSSGGNGISNTSPQLGLFGTVRILGATAAVHTRVFYETSYHRATDDVLSNYSGAGSQTSTTVFNAVRVRALSGTFSGSASLRKTS